MATYNLLINMDGKCRICNGKGIMPNGICMGCAIKKLNSGEFDNVIARAKERQSDVPKKTEADQR